MKTFDYQTGSQAGLEFLIIFECVVAATPPTIIATPSMVNVDLGG